METRSFAELLKQHRIDRTLTQEELAERAGLSVRGVSDLERGINKSPRLVTVRLLADALDLPPSERAIFQAVARGSTRDLAPAAPEAGEVAAFGAETAQLLTVLIADMRGYTAYTADHGDAAAAALAERFARRTRPVAEQFGGTLLELRGDEAVCLFASARQALQAALALQQQYQGDGADGGLALGVGIGLDAGEVVPVDGGYRGRALNLAARLCALAGGGDVLASESVLHLAGETEGIGWVDRGPVTLKGLPEPVRVIQVGQKGERTAEPPTLQALRPTQPTNLPDEATPFIGRSGEITAIAALVEHPTVRLVVLTGPGGTGKTRLALQVGARLLDRFPDGVFFVSLAALTDPALVPSAIAAALSVPEEGGIALLTTLSRSLQGKRLLLVLDNYEHLLPAASVVSALLHDCRTLRILVTSRTPLHLAREQEYPVAPLALPDPDRLPATARLSQYDAVALFVDRARAIRPDFAVTDQNARAVAELCVRLDGLPLAIVLAASRLRLFSPQALLQRLANRLAVLTGGARDVPERQRTLRATLDWSYDLLQPYEQQLFAKLSVFAGGCTIEALEAVCGDSETEDPALWKALEELLDASLLQPGEGQDGETRFLMLETLREYAAETLRASGDADLVRGRHASYFQRFAAEAEAGFQSADQESWLTKLETEYDNILAALGWAMARPDGEPAVALAASLQWFWGVRGYWTEGRRWLDDALRRAAGSRSRANIQALTRAGALATSQGDYDEARRLLEEGLALARDTGDPRSIAEAAHELGRLAGDHADFEQAQALLEESLELYRAMGESWWVGAVTNALGGLAFYAGDFERGRSLVEEALAVARKLGQNRVIAIQLNNLATISNVEGDRHRARRLAEQSVEMLREVGDRRNLALALMELAMAAQSTADGDRSSGALRESLMLLQEIDDKFGLAQWLESCARVAAIQEDANRAAMLYGAARALRASLDASMTPGETTVLESDLASARAELGSAWESAEYVGRLMTTESAIDLVLSPLP